MHPVLSVLTPQCIATEAFTNATAAVARLDEIYERNTGFLRERFEAYANGESIKTENHGVPVEVGESSEPIPVHFAFRRDINIEALLSDGEKLRIQRPVRDVFDTPDLAAMDDAISSCQRLSLPRAIRHPALRIG
jgi:hypothetical protein